MFFEALLYLRQLDPGVTDEQWLAAADATDWDYWPESDGDGHYISEEDYAILRKAVI